MTIDIKESFSNLNAYLFGTKDEPTWLRRTFGKAAEWVAIAFAVIFLLAVLSSCENSARQASSAAMRAPLSLYSSVANSLAPAEEPAPAKSKQKVCK